MKQLLQCENLTKEFAPGKGAKEISLEISKGEIVGFLGPNGAGKTTTIRMLMGLLPKEKGTINIFGQELNSLSEFHKVYEKIGFLPSEEAYYSELTSEQMFTFASKFKGEKEQNRKLIAKLTEILDIDLNKKIATLSLGNKKKVGVVLSLLNTPELLILDEPTSGLDPLIQREVLNLLREKAHSGTGVFLSSHNLAEVENTCERIIVIKDAEIVFSGTIREIKSQKKKRVEFRVRDKKLLEKITKNIESTLVEKKAGFVKILTTEPAQLVRVLLDNGIEDFTVENLTLEEMFINYYK